MKAAFLLIRCSGAMLVGAGLMLFLTNLATGELSTPRDPIFQISLRVLFWTMGGAMLGIGLFSIFSDSLVAPASWAVWIAINFWVYRLGLMWNGTPQFDGLLGALPETFGLARATVEGMTYGAFSFILLASGVVLGANWLSRRQPQTADGTTDIKIACNRCGGHIAFSATRSGERIPCPHCAELIVLKPA